MRKLPFPRFIVYIIDVLGWGKYVATHAPFLCWWRFFESFHRVGMTLRNAREYLENQPDA